MVRYILIVPFLLQSVLLMAALEKHQKLIISAGALDNSGIYDVFYQSGIFVSQNQAPFIISNAQTQAFAAHGAVFYSDKNLTADQVIKAPLKSKQIGRVSGVLAKSFAAMPLVAFELSDALSNYWGALPTNYYYEMRELDSGEKIYSFSQEVIKWPEHVNDLKILPAVVVQDNATKSPILVVARALGAWDKKLALVDQLIKNSGPHAAYIDLGLNESSRSFSADQELIKAVASRKPAAIMLGVSEIASLVQDSQALGALPVSYPFGDFSMRQAAHLKLWSVAGQEKLWPLFTSLGSLKRVSDATALMQKEGSRVINIIRVFSESAALEAARSPYVALVLLAVDHEQVQLPSQEMIEIQKGEMAPIVRISALDISEVIIHNSVEAKKVQITRHGVVSKNFEGGYVKPGELKESLPERLWTARDFDSVLAGMMIKQSKADVAIFESEKSITPINSAVDNNIARARLMRPGAIATAYISGKQLKKLAGVMAKKALSSNLVIFGMDPKTRQIRERVLNDAEKFKVVMSEKALLEIWGVAMLGGFSEEYAQRSIFAEQIGAKVTSLFFLSGIKMLPIADTAESLQLALSDFKARESFHNLLSSNLSKLSISEINTYISKPAGEARQSLTLGIDYLDVGFSQTFGNEIYKKGLTDKKFALISRGGIPLHAHVLLFSKMSLIYDTPYLETSLGNNIKYLHMDQLKQPERDKAIFTLDFRLPWERSLFKDKSVVISPILKNYYETKIGALPFLADPKQEAPKPRTKIFTSLLGTNVNFTDLGFNFDIGGMMGVDFNQSSAREAVTFGPGFNFSGRWALYGPLEISTLLKSYYLFRLPGTVSPNRLALGVEGTTWLRVARFYDFNLSLMADFFAASVQKEHREVAVSSILGLTISYGRFFRLFG